MHRQTDTHQQKAGSETAKKGNLQRVADKRERKKKDSQKIKNATKREIEREILARDREIIGEKGREKSLRKKAICR